MKLNNRGWGTMEMILLSSGILLTLLVAIFFISKLYGGMDKMLGNREYYNLEDKIENSARDYVLDKKISISGEYKISLSTLQSNTNIGELKDSDGNSCNGYVLVTKTNDYIEYNGYISCNNYQTENYS